LQFIDVGDKGVPVDSADLSISSITGNCFFLERKIRYEEFIAM